MRKEIEENQKVWYHDLSSCRIVRAGIFENICASFHFREKTVLWLFAVIFRRFCSRFVPSIVVSFHVFFSKIQASVVNTRWKLLTFDWCVGLVFPASRWDSRCSPGGRRAIYQWTAHWSRHSQPFQVITHRRTQRISTSAPPSWCKKIRVCTLQMQMLHSYCLCKITISFAFTAFWTSSEQKPGSWRGFKTWALKENIRANCWGYQWTA